MVSSLNDRSQRVGIELPACCRVGNDRAKTIGPKPATNSTSMFLGFFKGLSPTTNSTSGVSTRSGESWPRYAAELQRRGSLVFPGVREQDSDDILLAFRSMRSGSIGPLLYLISGAHGYSPQRVVAVRGSTDCYARGQRARSQTGTGTQLFRCRFVIALPAIITQNQLVSDFPADGKPCQSGDCKRVHHLIAKPKSPLGLWR